MKNIQISLASLLLTLAVIVTDGWGLFVLAGPWPSLPDWAALAFGGFTTLATIALMPVVFDAARTKIALFNSAWDAFLKIGIRAVQRTLIEPVWGWCILPVLRDKEAAWGYEYMAKVVRAVVWAGAIVSGGALVAKLLVGGGLDVVACQGALPGLLLPIIHKAQGALPRVDVRSNEEIATALRAGCERLSDGTTMIKASLYPVIDGLVDGAANIGRTKLLEWISKLCPSNDDGPPDDQQSSLHP